MRLSKQLIFLFTITLVLLIQGCSSSNNDNEESSEIIPTPSVNETPVSNQGRIWTVAEILAEPRIGGSGGTPKCGGENGFRRCLCPDNVPSSIVYRPAVVECNGNAAAILFNDLVDVFSIVVRDSQNRDRWPASGFNGCSASLASSESPPASCSAFKVQDKFEVAGGLAKVNCFGASGYSELFSDVTRMTIKFTDDPFSSDDEIGRYCIKAPTLPLN